MDMKGKTVLITGGSSGIGRSTAVMLASMGARVVFTGQTSAKTEQVAKEVRTITGKEDVTGMTLNLGEFDDIKRFVQDFLRKEERLDVLINNAAYLGPNDHVSNGMEKTFSVNHFGHFMLTLLLLKRLNECSPSRVVCVTSDSHRKSWIPLDDLSWLLDPMKTKNYDIYESYARSKLGNVLFAEELNRRFAQVGVTSYSVHPGIIRTSLLRNWPGSNGRLLRGVAKLFFDTPEKGAQAVVHCATQPGLERHAGNYFKGKRPKDTTTKSGDAERLWEFSTGVCFPAHQIDDAHVITSPAELS
ncbi:retinol dehydrogenase 11-like [Lineus longissimus]|uniref:retinol dehydrogenase 11-like n=1 Tax=Lineus longissimus TaxID=88925 RepID=UPI00315D8137